MMSKTGALVLLGCLFLSSSSFCAAQELKCKQVEANARMTRAESTKVLLDAKQHAGDDYRAQIVFAYRSFQLHPRTQSAAERLLALIPKTEEQQRVVMTLGDSLCDGESMDDMGSLSRVNEGLARQLRKAVELAPQFMPAYVEYSLEAATDPHSDYAVEMQRVCQRNHGAFVRAVKQLPVEKAREFKEHIMKPEGCRVLAIPEAE